VGIGAPPVHAAKAVAISVDARLKAGHDGENSPSMTPPIEEVPGLLRPAVLRGVGFFVFWVLLSGGAPADLPVGIVAAAAAAWASLRLLPPGNERWRPLALARLAMRFPVQSLIAGLDVARRAFSPRLPLHPGFVVYPARLPEGPARHAFASLMSLLPGSLPAGSDAGGGMLVHCLDTRQPVAEQLAAEEALFARVIGGSMGDG
jgi:multicomponent Na+:H+ antiporter subunit E